MKTVPTASTTPDAPIFISPPRRPDQVTPVKRYSFAMYVLLGFAHRGGRPSANATSSPIDWFCLRTLLCVEPGKSVRAYFYTPHSWRLMQNQH